MQLPVDISELNIMTQVSAITCRKPIARLWSVEVYVRQAKFVFYALRCRKYNYIQLRWFGSFFRLRITTIARRLTSKYK